MTSKNRKLADAASQKAAAQYDSKKPLSEKELRWLKPGHWIQVKWLDADDAVYLVLEVDRRPRKKTVTNIRLFDPSGNHALGPVFNLTDCELDQVLRIVGEVQVPTL